MDLTTILFIFSLPFVLLTAYFGTKNDFYESENYKGDGVLTMLRGNPNINHL